MPIFTASVHRSVRNELLMADYLRKMPQDQIDAMAHTFTEGYRKGFEMAGKDIHAKKTVKIEAPLGMERKVKAPWHSLQTWA